MQNSKSNVCKDQCRSKSGIVKFLEGNGQYDINWPERQVNL